MVGGEKDNENFYYNGKWFNTFEEMVEYSIEWGNTCVSEASLSIMLSYLKKEILINMAMTDTKITNKEMENILSVAFLSAMKERK